MSELMDRRARKKAHTRALIRQTAQDLFADRGFDAVTIADIATSADVAVQTVFNHFATKEDLFFDGRVPWVRGPAEAVRSRSAGTPALAALQEYLRDRVGGHVRLLGTPEGRSYVGTLEASPALRARERDLHHESMTELADALLDAWVEEGEAPADPAGARTAASLTASVWLAAVRTLIREQRWRVTERPDGAAGAWDPEHTAQAASGLADRVFDGLGMALRRVGDDDGLRPTG